MVWRAQRHDSKRLSTTNSIKGPLNIKNSKLWSGRGHSEKADGAVYWGCLSEAHA
jgi:hypothetical protein